MNNISTHHHYIPQFYLRFFYDQARKQVHAFNCTYNKGKWYSSKAVGWEDGYNLIYQDGVPDDRYEKLLASKIENQQSVILTNAIQDFNVGGFLSPEAEIAAKMLFGRLYVANPRFREFHGVGNLDVETASDEITKIVAFGLALPRATVFVIPDGEELITSSRPFINGSIDGEFIFVMSPKHFIHFSDEILGMGGIILPATIGLSKKINAELAQSEHVRWLFSRDPHLIDMARTKP